MLLNVADFFNKHTTSDLPDGMGQVPSRAGSNVSAMNFETVCPQWST